jgi:DNA ligase-associated metallophosphoesterase
MNTHTFPFASTTLTALPSGALYYPAESLLCVSDLHLGKSDRIARRQGLMLPPFETEATLDRLDADLATTGARTVICLGDSFDDTAAADSLTEDNLTRLLQLQAGRRWIWIAGNHDPAPLNLGGTHLAAFHSGPLTFRHAATPSAVNEVSGHYHPKLALPGAGGARPCFVFDNHRLILPAYGTYTGGLHATDPALRSLFAPRAFAILTGRKAILAPLPLARPDRAPPIPIRRAIRRAIRD